MEKSDAKAAPSKEGSWEWRESILQTLRQCFEKAGVTAEKTNGRREEITKADLFLWGLSGTDGACAKRQELLQKPNFPRG